MPGNRKHHTDKWHSCVEKVMAQGKTESEASAICTTSLQDAGEPIFEGAEMHHLHLLGATGQTRMEMHEGRPHLVVPVVMLMEGVIHAVNSDSPEFVPLQTLRKAAATWNGRPVVVGHPAKDGRQCSANSPTVLASHGIGTVFNSRVESKKLLGEAWIDVEKAQRVNKSMYNRLLENKGEEVSVGAYVVTDGSPGTYDNKQYKSSWLETIGDHLAFLPGGRGACSREMGCGTHRAAEVYCVTAQGFKTLGGPGSGWTAEGGHVPGSQGGRAESAGKNADRHSWAAKQHEQAAFAHDTLASYHEKGTKLGDPKGIEKAVTKSTELASSLTKETGAKPYGAEAARAYAKMAKEAKAPAEKAKYHREAAKMHRAAAQDHTAVVDRWKADVVKSWRHAEDFFGFIGAEGLEPVPDDLVDFGLNSLLAVLKSQKPKYEDCPVCKGSGNVGKNPCEACDGAGELKVAAGARHSSEDVALIQAVHDHAMALGAKCERSNYKMLEQPEESKRIRHEGGRWLLYSKDGSRRLGTHNTEAEAKAQETAIEAAQHRRNLELASGTSGSPAATHGRCSCGN